MDEISLLEHIAIADKDAPFDEIASLEIAVQNIQINTALDYRRCNELLRVLNKGIKVHKGYWEPLRVASLTLYEKVLDRINAKLSPANRLRALLLTKMSDFERQQRELLKTAQDKATAAHHAQIAKATEESTKLLVAGKAAEAFSVMQQARSSLPVVPVPDLKLPGTNKVADFDVEITDIKAFLQEIIDGNVPLQVSVMRKLQDTVSVRISCIKELRRSMGDGFHINGVKVTEKTSYRQNV